MDKEKIEVIKGQMSHYTTVGTVMAIPMTRGEYCDLRGWDTPADGHREDPGYLMEDANGLEPNVDGFKGYVSWLPESLFRKRYNKSETLKQRLFIEMDQLYRRMFLLRKYQREGAPESDAYSLISIQLKAMEAYHLALLMRYEKMNQRSE